MARSARVATFTALSFGLFALVVAACSGSTGDSCRREGDCSSALICCRAGVPTTAGERGVCQSGCEAVEIDAGTDTDAGP